MKRKMSRYRSTFLVRLLGVKYQIFLALVGYLLIIFFRFLTMILKTHFLPQNGKKIEKEEIQVS